MSEQPTNETIADDELIAATGGIEDGEPFPSGDPKSISGPENEASQTSCL